MDRGVWAIYCLALFIWWWEQFHQVIPDIPTHFHHPGMSQVIPEKPSAVVLPSVPDPAPSLITLIVVIKDSLNTLGIHVWFQYQPHGLVGPLPKLRQCGVQSVIPSMFPLHGSSNSNRLNSPPEAGHFLNCSYWGGTKVSVIQKLHNIPVLNWRGNVNFCFYYRFRRIGR